MALSHTFDFVDKKMAEEREIASLAIRLTKEVLDAASPSTETCQDLLQALRDIPMSLSMLKTTQIGKTLSKTVKSFKRHKRTSSTEQSLEWDQLVTSADKLLSSWKTTAEEQEKAIAQSSKKTKTQLTNKTGLPNTITEYRARLVQQKKDMYKDPPALPPSTIHVEKSKCLLPKRDKTGALLFLANDTDVQTLLTDFRPNRTPEEILRAGAFGGTYFRPIASAVTNLKYNSQAVLKETVADVWIEGLDSNLLLSSSTYRPQVNKYGVKCGGSLGMWESSGWITDVDPFGWFQWYCRFYQGRRCSDDARQISRWLKSAGAKGRFRSQLCNKILAKGGKHYFEDASISPVIRQTLLHWGLEITPDIIARHEQRIGSRK
jgi:hypothetical protein